MKEFKKCTFSSRRVDRHMGAALEGKKGEEKEKATFYLPTHTTHKGTGVGKGGVYTWAWVGRWTTRLHGVTPPLARGAQVGLRI